VTGNTHEVDLMAKRDDSYWHNKGQEDRAADRGYQPPHGMLEDLTTWTDAGMRRNTEENSQYRTGWNHTNGQKKD
jgi:hypothetical protein